MSYPDDIPTSFENRDPEAGVNSLFSQRWSPRAFKKQSIADQDLRIIMDAARWSPSAMNEQPWRIYTSTESTFDDFYNLLLPGNQIWAGAASVLGFFVAERFYVRNGKENATSDFDTGAAWMAMTLQARQLGLYTHGMGGIDKERVYQYLNLNQDNAKVIAGFAMGVIDSAENLPEEQKEREKPSGRKPLEEIWFQI